ncbi:hypothetical protein CPJCM30710_17810 [Clostridium polyendosporum]|uniref:Sulfatase N-terminal domain-containing protein n=1 Tax=Clostridium polyendosporum TaxID=69208 RepID=A0A919VG68_9CLOT|nr:alkaline phosphatase family protein [Clostridium polyendosporum]GIM29115.1 hypothetical protein CPJCM30710_17810 [Clostridium polyendosporum]
MKKQQYKLKINTIFMLLFLVASVIDIVKINNAKLILANTLISSFNIFTLGVTRFNSDKRKGLTLLAVNVLFLLMTFRDNIYSFNMFIISFFIWRYITPKIIKFKRVFLTSIVVSFLAIYFFSIVNINIPIFTIVFYPIYLFGYMIRDVKLQKPKNQIKIILTILIISFLALVVCILKSRGLSITENISFLKFHTKRGENLVLLPYIVLFYISFSLSVNYLIYRYTCLFKANKYAFKDLNIKILNKYILNFVIFFSVIFILVFVGEYTIRGQLLTTAKSIISLKSILNITFLSGVYLALISIINMGLSTLIIIILGSFLILGNFIKIKFFDEPLYPWDIYLIKNALLISGGYISTKIITIAVAVAVVFLFIIIKFRKAVVRTLKPKPVLYLLPIALVLNIANFMITSRDDLLSDLGMGKSWYVGKDEVLANGFFMQNFFYATDLKMYLDDKPKDYSEEKISAIAESLASDNTVQATVNSNKKPNIVMIMSESFWDPTQFDNVSFSKDINKNLKQYQKGKIVSPVFGGGTANVEFEALTGLSTYFTNPGVIPYNAYLRRNTPSIATVLKNNDYKTIAIHPNDGEFYNRNKVYNYLGFDKFIDISGFNKNTDNKGLNISDDKLVDKILNTLNEDNNPKFIFAVTMQNHDPYYDIYNPLEVTAKSDKLNDIETSILSNYASGIYDSDKALGKLIDSLSKSGTPTIVYYFGDHLPRLGYPEGVYDVYNKLDYFKDINNISKDITNYETPFVAWSNYKEIKSLDTPISPAQIALQVLKDSNVYYPSYFNILDELRKDYPYLQNNINSQDLLNEKVISDYKLIQYDLLFGKQYQMK